MERKMNKLRKAGKNSEADAIRVKLDPEFAAKMTLKDLPKIREDPSLGVIVENLKHFAEVPVVSLKPPIIIGFFFIRFGQNLSCFISLS